MTEFLFHIYSSAFYFFSANQKPVFPLPVLPGAAKENRDGGCSLFRNAVNEIQSVWWPQSSSPSICSHSTSCPGACPWLSSIRRCTEVYESCDESKGAASKSQVRSETKKVFVQVPSANWRRFRGFSLILQYSVLSNDTFFMPTFLKIDRQCNEGSSTSNT